MKPVKEHHFIASKAFTLVELLVVIAISSVLIGLLLRPLLDTYNATQRVQKIAEAQSQCRLIMANVTREMQDAAYIFDNSLVFNPYRLASGDTVSKDATILVKIPNPNDGRLDEFCLPYAKIDMAFAVKKQDQNATQLDPTDGSPYVPPARKGDQEPYLPLQQSMKVVRYFIGLSDPFKTYHNKSEMGHTGTDNPYILWRAEYWLYNPEDGTPNSSLFELADGQPVLNDPDFFQNEDTAPTRVAGARDINGDGKISYMENWLAVSRPVSRTSNIDMISIGRDSRTKDMLLDQNSGPLQGRIFSVTSLVRFTPELVAGDPAVPGLDDDAANEAASVTSGSVRVPPMIYTTKQGSWTWPANIVLFRSSPANPSDNQDMEYYKTTVLESGIANGWRSGDTIVLHVLESNGKTDESPAFNISLAQRLRDSGCFDPETYQDTPCKNLGDPFHSDVSPANNPSGRNWNNLAQVVGFLQNAGSGELNFALPSMLLNSDHNPAINVAVKDIKAYDESGRRYFMLDRDADGKPTGLGALEQVNIVPGSEKVFGPDMRPGAGYGRQVRYNRVPFGSGRIPVNCYRIQYVQMGDKTADAALQVGYVQLNNETPLDTVSDSGFSVSFDFQTNTATDVVRVDYLSRSAMTVALTIREYDRRGNPAEISLSNKVKIRNILQ